VGILRKELLFVRKKTTPFIVNKSLCEGGVDKELDEDTKDLFLFCVKENFLF
jgi:hypothetical protein